MIKGGGGLATAAAGLLDVLSLFDVEVGLLPARGGDCRGSHSFLVRQPILQCPVIGGYFDLSGHSQESLFYVCSVLGRRFKEWDAKTICEFLHLLVLPKTKVRDLCDSVFNDFLVAHI